MPLTRYQIRNEYGLADPELYRAADKDDPEALLEGVAMAGLVGLLRQLGDLAEFAAEIFHDLHEEVMGTAARGHGLMVRVQQLEAEFPSIEKAFLSQTDQSPYFSKTGVDWHPNLKMEQKLITSGDLPRCVMDSYEECRGPPRLFLLDKFDVAGAGACLKRYADPSFFRGEGASLEAVTTQVQREKNFRKAKRKGSHCRSGQTPDPAPTSHAKLHQLFLAERIESGHSDPARLVKLKTRKLTGSPLNSKSGRSYMEKFLESPSPQHKTFSETYSNPQLLTWSTDTSGESASEVPQTKMLSGAEISMEGKEMEATSPDIQEFVSKSSMDTLNGEIVDRDVETVPEPTVNDETDGIPATPRKTVFKEEYVTYGKGTAECILDKNHSEDLTSEVDNYMDALATMESEVETDNECRSKDDSRFLNVRKHETDLDMNVEQVEIPYRHSDSQSIGNTSASEDGYSSFKRERSSFSYSDTVSESTENEPYDGQEVAEALISTEPCIPKVVEASLSYSHDIESVSGSTADKASLPRLEEASCSLNGTNPSPVLIPRDPGLGTPLDFVNFGSESLRTNENGGGMAASSAVSTVCSEDKFESGDPDAPSGARLNLSKIADLAPEANRLNYANGEVFQTIHGNDNHSEIPMNGESSFLKSFIPPTKDQFLPFAKKEEDSRSSLLAVGPDAVKPDDIVSGIGGLGPETEVDLESISSLDTETYNVLVTKEGSQVSLNGIRELMGENSSVGTEADETISEKPEEIFGNRGSVDSETSNGFLLLEVSSESQKQMVDKSCDYMAVKPDVAALEGLDFEQKPYLGMVSQDTGSDEERRLCKHDDSEEYPVPLECWSNNPGETGHVSESNVAADTVCCEDTASSTTCVLNAGDDSTDIAGLTLDSVCSLSRSLLDVQESISSADDRHQLGIESKEMLLAEGYSNLQVEKQMNSLEVAAAGADPISSKTLFYNCCSQEVSNDIQDSYLTKNSSLMVVDDPSTRTSSPELNSLCSETKSAHKGNLLGNGEDVSSAACYIPELERPLDQSKKLQACQVDHMQADKGISKPAITESKQILDLDYKEKDLDALPESCADDFPLQKSSAEVLPKSSISEIQTSKQGRNVKSALPSFGLFPEAAQASLEEIPPLPPLPPMQWLFGKVPNPPAASPGESVENGAALFPSISLSPADRAGCSSNAASAGGTSQPPNFILPLTEGKMENHSEQFESNMVHPSLPEFPAIVNDANSEPDSITLEKTQSANSFLALPAVANASPEQSYVSSEGSLIRSASNSLLPEDPGPSGEHATHMEDLISSQTMSPCQLAVETASKMEATEQISQNSAESENLLDSGSSIPSPLIKVEEQIQTSAQSSKAEEQKELASLYSWEGMPPPSPTTKTTLSSSLRDSMWPVNAFALAPTFEVEKANEIPVVRLPRPRSPLVDAFAAHDRSMLRKVSERPCPPIESKGEERDSLLAEIRNKSFSLKPAMVTRPSIQVGPKTNLKVAAILEKANTIRQAMAGSDEDDDSDSWSDS